MNSKNNKCKCKEKILRFPNLSNLENKLENFYPKRPYDSVIPISKIIPFEELIPYLKLRSLSDSTNSNIDPTSGARVVNVMPYELPSSPNSKVLGMYDPNTHTIYIANNLSQKDREFVYHHEVAHALGERDETRADNYAQSKTGYMLPGRERYHRMAA
jgi:hypothetical protein